jgi:hypothetical protein
MYNKTNLILIDPFFADTQVAHFQSNNYYDNDLFLLNDSIITSSIQASMVKKGDLKFKTFIWTQFPQDILRSKIMSGSGAVDDIDSDDQKSDNDGSDDGIDAIIGVPRYIPVRMILDHKSFIYYVMKSNG